MNEKSMSLCLEPYDKEKRVTKFPVYIDNIAPLESNEVTLVNLTAVYQIRWNLR